MGRSQAIRGAQAAFASGRFLDLLTHAVGFRTESQEPGRHDEMHRYFQACIVPLLEPAGFSFSVHDNPVREHGPLLLAQRVESPALPTLLMYGHGDVVRGYDAQWRTGLSPWTVTTEADRWYGRGTADNKGQHLVNMLALTEVIRARAGALGFNVKFLLEMGEEAGSPGLRAFCEAQREALAADLFIASDGPRLNAPTPTLVLGSRGAFNFDLAVELRPGAHHSGNWGGLLRNPGTVLAHAIASLVDANGQILVDALKPAGLPASVRNALANIEVGGLPGEPEIDPRWGEPDLTPAERVFGWNTVEVLAFKTGNPDAPVNAIPGRATAHCQIRFVAGCDHTTFIPAMRAHLDARGFAQVRITQAKAEVLHASRLDPGSPWVAWALQSMADSTGKTPALLPNIGGSLPNDIFADVLGLPTLWIPHSYPACSQHAPDEHLLASVAEEGLRLMAGLYWDLGEDAARIAGAPAGTAQATSAAALTA